MYDGSLNAYHLDSITSPINGTIKSGCLWFRLFQLLIRKPPVVVSCKSVSEINRQSIHLLAQWGSNIFIIDINFANYKFRQSCLATNSNLVKPEIILFCQVCLVGLLMERRYSAYGSAWVELEGAMRGNSLVPSPSMDISRSLLLSLTAGECQSWRGDGCKGVAKECCTYIAIRACIIKVLAFNWVN